MGGPVGVLSARNIKVVIVFFIFVKQKKMNDL